jgi:hypothetical protein
LGVAVETANQVDGGNGIKEGDGTQKKKMPRGGRKEKGDFQKVSIPFHPKRGRKKPENERGRGEDLRQNVKGQHQ